MAIVWHESDMGLIWHSVPSETTMTSQTQYIPDHVRWFNAAGELSGEGSCWYARALWENRLDMVPEKVLCHVEEHPRCALRVMAAWQRYRVSRHLPQISWH